MGQFDWLTQLPRNTIFTVFDTETTGLQPKQNRIIELGAIQFDYRGIISRFNTLINPGVRVPPEVTQVNNITNAMLNGQPQPENVFFDFLDYIQDTIVIAHNASFDISFLNEELQRILLPPLSNKIIDTLVFSKEMFPGLPKYSLQELAKRFNINALNAHRAEDDSRVCMELFMVCLKKLKELHGISIEEESIEEANTQEEHIADRKENDLDNDLDEEYFDDLTEFE